MLPVTFLWGFFFQVPRCFLCQLEYKHSILEKISFSIVFDCCMGTMPGTVYWPVWLGQAMFGTNFLVPTLILRVHSADPGKGCSVTWDVATHVLLSQCQSWVSKVSWPLLCVGYGLTSSIYLKLLLCSSPTATGLKTLRWDISWDMHEPVPIRNSYVTQPVVHTKTY